jgi:hypothetical protein
MLPQIYKTYATKIKNKEIITIADFFKTLPDIQPFDKEINTIKYPHEILISDFQILLKQTEIFIETVNLLKDKKLIYLYFNPKLTDSISIIQNSHRSQKYEISQPIHDLVRTYIENEIRITDTSFLNKFIKHDLLPDKEYYENKQNKLKYWVTISALIVPTATLLLAIFLNFVCNKKPHSINSISPIHISDTLNVNIVSKYPENKIDHLDTTKILRDTINRERNTPTSQRSLAIKIPHTIQANRVMFMKTIKNMSIYMVLSSI